MIRYGTNAKLAFNTILREKSKRIPNFCINVMQHDQIEYFAHAKPGDYKRNHREVYLKFQSNIGTCCIDQYIPDNPLSMGDHGYEHGNAKTAGIYVDDLLIDSPEAVVEHLEKYEFLRLQKETDEFDQDAHVKGILEREKEIQEEIGYNILKTGHDFIRFPGLGYYTYGYENYFMAYALYPEIMERHFKLQADLFLEYNKGAARAYAEGNLSPLFRLDHDITDSKGTLVDIKSLDRIWFPHFARCLEPVIQAGINLIWHCDGNLMQMVPRLLDVGLKGFQGFQYECGMDYVEICKMKTKEKEDLIIVAGVSVTRTIPHGTADDVRKELKFLVKHGPETGLFLAASSSITPGVPLENLKALVEGFQYYREHGRD